MKFSKILLSIFNCRLRLYSIYENFQAFHNHLCKFFSLQRFNFRIKPLFTITLIKKIIKLLLLIHTISQELTVDPYELCGSPSAISDDGYNSDRINIKLIFVDEYDTN